MSYMENKITEARDQLDIVDRFEFDYKCTKELKIHPQELGPLINMSNPDFDGNRHHFSPIKHFEFYPDYLFECIRLKAISFKQFEERKELLKGGCFWS